MRPRDKALGIQLVLLVLLTIFALHLLAHATGTYQRLGWLT